MSDEEARRNRLLPGDEAPPAQENTGEDICPACGGSGRRNGRECPDCGGTGRIEEAVGGG